MKALLSFLWSGCWHKWRIYDRGTWQRPGFGGGCITGKWNTLQCEKCGNLKQVDA